LIKGLEFHVLGHIKDVKTLQAGKRLEICDLVLADEEAFEILAGREIIGKDFCD
jgi:hypothetical protein